MTGTVVRHGPAPWSGHRGPVRKAAPLPLNSRFLWPHQSPLTPLPERDTIRLTRWGSERARVSAHDSPASPPTTTVYRRADVIGAFRHPTRLPPRATSRRNT